MTTQELMAALEGRIIGGRLHNGGYIHVPQEEAEQILSLLKEEQETITSLQSTISKLTQAIEEQPGQRHGHWQITEFFPHNVCCSLCHHRFAQTHWDAWESGQLPRKYCPNCGAKMDGRW